MLPRILTPLITKASSTVNHKVEKLGPRGQEKHSYTSIHSIYSEGSAGGKAVVFMQGRLLNRGLSVQILWFPEIVDYLKVVACDCGIQNIKLVANPISKQGEMHSTKCSTVWLANLKKTKKLLKQLKFGRKTLFPQNSTSKNYSQMVLLSHTGDFKQNNAFLSLWLHKMYADMLYLP